jgi:transcription elongation factor GreB
MSKAFTKDDGPDAAPVQRRRAPLPAGVPNYVTHRGLGLLREELAALDAEAAPDAAPIERQARAARRAELEERIATAVVAPPPGDLTEVRIGAWVRVSSDSGARELRIVGVDEADPTSRPSRVAFTAPLARALLGRRAGDTTTARTPAGEETLEIERVSYDAPD